MGLKIKFLYTKNTIYKNKFCAVNHTTKAIIRYMPKLKMWMPPFDVIKYKKEYYQKNKLKQQTTDEQDISENKL